MRYNKTLNVPEFREMLKELGCVLFHGSIITSAVLAQKEDQSEERN